MSGRKPSRFAAVMALMALAVVAGGLLATNSTGTLADFEWSAPAVLTLLHP